MNQPNEMRKKDELRVKWLAALTRRIDEVKAKVDKIQKDYSLEIKRESRSTDHMYNELMRKLNSLERRIDRLEKVSL